MRVELRLDLLVHELQAGLGEVEGNVGMFGWAGCRGSQWDDRGSGETEQRRMYILDQ